MTCSRTQRALAAALCTLATLAAACARPPRLARPASEVEARTLFDALAARERVMRELRITMKVRVSGGTAAALLASPAFMALGQPGAIRMQVLSPFGITVLDLTITGDDYQLTLPLRGETRKGKIDLGTVAASGAPVDERMIVALALLFRPKIDAQACSVESVSTVVCSIGTGLSATITVDDNLRPKRERYTRADGTVLLSAEYGEYGEGGSEAMAGHIEISDLASATALIARVLCVRTADSGGKCR